jgi:signal transduction histidine kinase
VMVMVMVMVMVDNNSKSNNRTILIVFILFILIGTLSLSVSTWRALRISSSHTPAINISKDIRYEIAVFHLWLEEYIAGDETLDKATVWKHINLSKRLSNILLYGGEYYGDQIDLILNEALRKDVVLLLNEIVILDGFAQSRLDGSQQGQAGSKMDAEFDEQYQLIQSILLLVDDSISVFIEIEIRRFVLLNVGTGLLILLLGVGLIVLFFIREREVKEATAKIIQASKLATLGEMATSVAHELNQPLNVIRMAAGNSRRKISNGTADFEYLSDKLERIEGQTVRAAAIIDHMRMFGREAKEEPELIDPRKVVLSALELVGEQLQLNGIEVVTELPDACLSVFGHTIQMEQVILNLLTNARDAIAESGGEAKITLRVFEDDKGVYITSEDTGGGIPEDALPRIFEPFYTTKAMDKGTGLGLSVGYGIVREMNGTLVAENIDGGARFTITLPIGRRDSDTSTTG